MGSRLLLPLVVTSFAALVANPKPVLNLFAGRLTTFNDNAVWAQHGALNNEKCWVEPGMEIIDLEHWTYDTDFNVSWTGL